MQNTAEEELIGLEELEAFGVSPDTQTLIWFVMDFVNNNPVHRTRLDFFLVELKLLAERDGIPSALLPCTVIEFYHMLNELKFFFFCHGIVYDFDDDKGAVEIIIKKFNFYRQYRQ